MFMHEKKRQQPHRVWVIVALGIVVVLALAGMVYSAAAMHAA